MKIGKIIATAVTALALSACVAPVSRINVNHPQTVSTPVPRINVNDPQAVSSAVSVQRDDFRKITNYKGPNASSNTLDQVFIRAWKTDATGSIAYQIYVMDYYDGDWRFYDSAHDSNGNSLNTTLISRDVDSCGRFGCSHREHLGLNVTREYL
jgi:hypothetical protein